MEHPEAVKQLHREFLRAGSDVMQAFTYYASEDKLTNRKVSFSYIWMNGNTVQGIGDFDIGIIQVKQFSKKLICYRGNEAGKKIGVEAINREACRIAKEVAAEGDALVLGGISQCPTYLSGGSKQAVQAEFRKQIKFFVEEGLDFLLCEVQ